MFLGVCKQFVEICDKGTAFFLFFLIFFHFVKKTLSLQRFLTYTN